VTVAPAVILAEVGIALSVRLVNEFGIEAMLTQPVGAPDLVQGVGEVDAGDEQ